MLIYLCHSKCNNFCYATWLLTHQMTLKLCQRDANWPFIYETTPYIPFPVSHFPVYYERKLNLHSKITLITKERHEIGELGFQTLVQIDANNSGRFPIKVANRKGPNESWLRKHFILVNFKQKMVAEFICDTVGKIQTCIHGCMLAVIKTGIYQNFCGLLIFWWK